LDPVSSDPVLVLASASLRRAHILRALGIAFRVVESGIDEALDPGEDGEAAVVRLARAKAEHVARGESLPVLAADTEVIAGGQVLGKPESPYHAARMLRLLAGRTHHVVTGVCLSLGGVVRVALDRTAVTFAPMSEEEVAWYVATGEPMGKAGAYHVDGCGSLFIEAVAGSPSNVAGLPVRLVLRLAREGGVDPGLP